MKYTIDQIWQLPEGQTFECKSVMTDPKALAVTIVAMANADGGTIAIGVSDKTRTIEGVDQDKTHLNDILRVPLDFCIPSIAVTTEYLPCKDAFGNDNHILLMNVPASSQLHTNQADEVFWRVGDKSRKLPFDDRLRLMYDKGERYYEDAPMYDATIEDIDIDVVAAYAKRIGYSKLPMEYLQENKGFITYKDGILQANNACVLLFGKSPQQFFPRARVRFIRYAGTEEKVGREMNVVKDVTFDGRILDQIQKTIEYLETQVKEYSYLGENGTFITDREYPKYVIQEMVVNSICHRDYSIKGTEIQVKMFDDRLVFETPGRLPGMVRVDNIRHTHFSRNPKIADYLKAYDYVKEFGEGVDRMCRELSSIGVEGPQYHLESFIMKATIYAHRLAEAPMQGQEKGQEKLPRKTTQKNYPEKARNYPEKVNINSVQKNILDYIKQNPKANRIEISAKLGNISEGGVKYNLKVLQEKGFLKRVGPDKGGHWEIENDEGVFD